MFVFEPFRLIDTIAILVLPQKHIQPIFIIGYYRSGTTYLQQLMSLDKKHSTMTLFASVLPEVSFLFGGLFIPLLNGLAKLLRIKNEFHYIPFRFDFPGEEDVGLNALSTFTDYNRIYQYPSNHESITNEFLIHLSPTSKKAFIENYKFLVKKVSYSTRSKVIILKSPPNLARVDLLKELFPNAKFIHIHRDPYRAVPSARRLWELNRSFAFQKYPSSLIDEILVHQYVRFYAAFHQSKGSKNMLTVQFDTLVTDTEETIKRIYNELELEGYDQIASAIHDAMNASKNVPRNHQPPDLSTPIIDSKDLAEIRNALGYFN
jgi:omega-hydroxy-beta-dihydromenaquinone-9 sulfotransferase